MSQCGWIGVDLDGTLAKYDGWVSSIHIGEPVGEMLFRVKKWLADGREVRIFTARAFPYGTHYAERGPCFSKSPDERSIESAAAINAIREWCEEHIGEPLTVTCIKDFAMVELWDDRAVQVEPNTGRRADGH